MSQSMTRTRSSAAEECGKPPLTEARAANAHEHSLTVRQALKSYPWAVVWALLISFSIIMEGYDTSLINSLYAYPSFARRFGTFDEATERIIVASWQSAMSSGPQGVGRRSDLERIRYQPLWLSDRLHDRGGPDGGFCLCIVFRLHC